MKKYFIIDYVKDGTPRFDILFNGYQDFKNNELNIFGLKKYNSVIYLQFPKLPDEEIEFKYLFFKTIDQLVNLKEFLIENKYTQLTGDIIFN
jgi:hypothetical protein